MRFVILGRPATKKTSQRIVERKSDKRKFIIPSKLSSDWAKEAVRQLKDQHRGQEPAAGDVVATYNVFRAANRGDLSNFISAIDDVLQAAGVIQNDNQSISINATKRIDRDNPRVEIALTVAEPEED